jgi:hypothetical protein
MTVTAGDVRRRMYRYLQNQTSWFDTAAWKVEGDEYIQKLVGSLERLADYVSALDDDDERLISLAKALDDASWKPEKLDEYLYSYIISTYGLSSSTGQAPDDFISGYVKVAVGIVRAHGPRR